MVTVIDTIAGDAIGIVLTSGFIRSAPSGSFSSPGMTG